MSLDVGLLFDPLFRLPFLSGLCLAITLPLVGAYIRLREAWLAALGLAQVAAAGGMLGAIFGMPAMAGAMLAAALTSAILGRGGRASNDAYAALLLTGWSATLLVAANAARGEDLTHAFLDGQLYFTGVSHLVALTSLLVVVAIMLPALSRRLLVARLFPEHERANSLPGWRHHAAFDLLAALTLALAATAVGVMATFAFVFVPPWVAFRSARGWRHALGLAIGLSLASYAVGFAGAILLDQPFGPVAVAAVLVLGAAYRLGSRATGAHRRSCAREPSRLGAVGEDGTQ
jgi:zinc/manganese transport system permease protein